METVQRCEGTTDMQPLDRASATCSACGGVSWSKQRLQLDLGATSCLSRAKLVQTSPGEDAGHRTSLQRSTIENAFQSSLNNGIRYASDTFHYACVGLDS
ncbi:unnamed protein product [Phytophthora lilii]|uniref:Unnamed protein product n=1 Tax=Phytophthora lilii TaxID=2077276 RepID=A0A9W6X049_9STRA|nr:unnamed protein product [Phytophthora lilii]